MIVEKAFASGNKYGEQLCGDQVLFGRTAKSYITVLSDGLGSGVKANILATLTTKVAMTMLEGGATLEEVVYTVGRTLPECKIRKLAYSTLTLLQINEDGSIYVVEFDNPVFFLLRHGSIVPLESKTRRIGSLVVREYRLQGQDDDLLVVVTDGIIHAGIGENLDFGWTRNKLGEYLEELEKHEVSLNHICESVLKNAREMSNNKLRDDATVVALKIRAKRRVTVAVGPPLDRNDDELFVQKLLAEKQIKVACGGTTATLIAREMQAELTIDLAQIQVESSIPPMGEIQGISLVTEGLLTLSAVLDFLKKGHIPADINGATRLCKFLLEADYIKFLVGRSINPAHQNPDLPVHLSLKPQLISKIGQVLEALGKIIVIEYF